jgi:hypothetical protein
MRQLFKRKLVFRNFNISEQCEIHVSPYLWTWRLCALWVTRLSLCTRVSPNILKLLLLSSSSKKFSKFAGVVSEDKEMWIDVFRRLSDAVRRQSSEKFRTNTWFLFHENAPAHRSVLVKDFLAKNNVTTLELPSYSLDLAAPDFYMLPRLKSSLEGGRCCECSDIVKNATQELKRFSQTVFRECFQHLYSH